MNIFYVSRDPEVAAKSLCDKHVVKMILESAQLLSTAHHELGSGVEGMYKATHKNHPSAIWVRHSSENYYWLRDHALALCKEYTARYGRVHKTQAVIQKYLIKRPANIHDEPFTAPPQCMPDEYKHSNPVTAYRNYYNGDKAYMATWKQNKPKWFSDER